MGGAAALRLNLSGDYSGLDGAGQRGSGVFGDASYAGPTEWVEVRPGGRVVRLLRPSDPDRLLSDPAVYDRSRRDDYMPYWAYLWPGAYLLAEAVAGGSGSWPGGEALELGCGLGLAGLTALGRGLRVTFSDYDAEPLRFAARSAAGGGFAEGSYRAELLDWREPTSARYPLILGADVLYERRLVPLVAGVIEAMLAPGGEAWLAGPYRVATEDLPACLGRLGLAAESGPVEACDAEGRPLRGTLHRIRRA